MLDVKFLRENNELVKEGARKKHIPCDVDLWIEKDKKWREAVSRVEELRSLRNKGSLEVKTLSGDAKTQAIENMKSLNIELKELEKTLQPLEDEVNELLLTIPNVPARDVPDGKSDEENVEIAKYGQIPVFDFELKDHVDLGTHLKIIDIERGVKISGSRFYFLRGAGAMLELAILKYSMDHMINKGFTPLVVPMLVREQAMIGTGYFPTGREQAYYMEKDEMALVGTAEVSLTSYHSDEILDMSELPVRIVAMSGCFRREAGTYGKDTRGLYRIHQFQKVEQVVLCEADNDVSEKWHSILVRNSAEILEALKMPHRLVNVCAGDLGMGQVKKTDIECWMPSRKSYGETHSCSTFHEYQARRLKIRYKDENRKNRFVHTLNNTVIASPRILIPLLELNQQADGSVKVPKVLVPYMNGIEIIEPV
jgi:seryl-tRNA synthetase